MCSGGDLREKIDETKEEEEEEGRDVATAHDSTRQETRRTRRDQEKFPASAEAQREPPWRERALDLEKQLAGLKRNVLLDSKTRSALPAVCSGDNVPSSLESLDTLLAVHTTNKSAVPPALLFSVSDRALSALGALLTSALSPDCSRAPALLDALLSLIPRFLTSVLPLLARAADPAPKARSKRKRTTHRKAPEKAGTCSGGGGGGGGAGDAERVAEALLARIAAQILLPLVRAFASLAVRYLSALLPASPNTSQRASTSNSTRGSSTSSGGTHSDSPADLRPDAHALFNAALDALEGCAPEEAGTHAEARAMRAGVRSVARLVALETARELAKLYAEPGDSPRARSDGCARRSSPATSAQKHAA
ncbi:hypothetical protein CERSUDRAFT_101339, partial [Gelatoporia subvermispora B]